MRAFRPAGYSIILALATIVLPAAVAETLGGFPATLTLERAFPSNDGVELGRLRARDVMRHSRFLQSSSGVLDFPVDGTYDPYLVGLYFTRVKLGSPPREFYVQIDTGSDVLWVSCKSCSNCPTSSGLQLKLKFFDPSSSSTSSMLPCSDQRCIEGAQYSDTGCSPVHKSCGYTFKYGDGSGTSGYYVLDLMHFDKVLGNSSTSNTSAPVVFGCSTSQSGDLTKPERAVDGIIGFGQNGLSVISQLSSRAITPNVFSHCLKGGNGGGGTLVLGEAVGPTLTYSPLVPSQPHYNLNLQSIAVNGRALSINPAVFAASSNNRGTIIDSGTTLAYLADEAYVPFVSAITETVSKFARPIIVKENQCYIITTSVSEIFPTVSLNFSGGASMTLKPQEYLIQQNSIGNSAVWCIGFQKGQGITILGDIILKDKIVVYDLDAQRIGWANYDCSLSINVSAPKLKVKNDMLSAGRMGSSKSARNAVYELIQSSLMAFILHISVFGSFSFLQHLVDTV